MDQENGSEASHARVAVGQPPGHEISYTSGWTVYVEALVAGRGPSAFAGSLRVSLRYHP